MRVINKMKKTAAITVLMITCFTGYLYTQEKKIRLAVSPFDDTITAASEKEKQGSSISKSFEAVYSGIDRFFVREGGAVSEYLRNLALVQTGAGNPEALKGKPGSLQIDYLTVGSISKFGDRYEVDARTVNINDWSIVHARGCSAANAGSAVDDISWYIKENFTEKYLSERMNNKMEKPAITVCKFKDYNELAKNNGYSGAFSEILNSELGSFALISTIEMKYTEALINEKAFEMIGVIENNNSDEIYGAKHIDYRMVGDIRIFKDVICVNYRLVNTSDKRIAYMGSSEITSPSALRAVSRMIANTIEDVLNNKAGTLKLVSEPGECEVFIDNDFAGKSSLVKTVQKGEHEIRVMKEGYVTYRSNINIQPKQVNEVKVKLEEVSNKLLEEAYKFELQKNFDKAIASYSQFIEKYKDTISVNQAYYRKGHLEIQMKKYGDALKTFQALVNRYPDTMTRSEGYMGIIQSCINLGDRQKAIETRAYLLEKYGDTSAAASAREMKI